jgi:hypothetical protein
MNADKVLQVVPKEFYDAYAKHTELTLEQGIIAKRKILYEYMSADSLEEVIEKLTGPTQVVELKEAILRYIIVSGFTPAGDPARLIRAEVAKVIQASIHTMDCVTFDEEDDDAMTMDVSFPSEWIGSEAFRSVVCNSTLLTTSQVDVHSVVYLPSSQSLLKKPKLEACIFWSCI